MGKITILCCMFLMVIIVSSASASFTWIYDDSGEEQAAQLIVMADDGLLVAGETDSAGQGGYDLLLMRFDSDGQLLWERLYGGAGNDVAVSIRPTSDGGAIVSGMTDSGGQGGLDALLVRIDGDGNIVWARTYGGSDDDFAYDAVELSNGDIAVTGMSLGVVTGIPYLIVYKVDSGGAVEWRRAYGEFTAGTTVVELTNGDIAVGGVIAFPLTEDTDHLVVTFSPSGSLNVQQRYGGTDNDSIHTIQPAANGGIAVAGYSRSFGAGDYDWQIFLLDSGGQVSWSRIYGGAGDEGTPFLIPGALGQWYVSGPSSSLSPGDEADCLVMSLASNGSVNWQRSLDLVDLSAWGAIKRATNGALHLAGLVSLPDGSETEVLVFGLDSEGQLPGCPLFGSVSLPTSVTNLQAQSVNLTSATPTLSSSAITFTEASWGATGYDPCLAPTATEAPSVTPTPTPTPTAPPFPSPTPTPTGTTGPSPTPDATPTPSGSVTPSATPTPTTGATLTPTPSATRTPVSSPTFVPTSTSTPQTPPPATNTPGATATATFTPTAPSTSTPSVTMTPAPTATAPCVATGVRLEMPADFFRAGDPCGLQAFICNDGGVPVTVLPVFVFLDVYGDYWFAPSWTQDLAYYQIELAIGLTELPVIPEFPWPEGAGSAEGIIFWGAITDAEVTEVIGEIGQVIFGWG